MKTIIKTIVVPTVMILTTIFPACQKDSTDVMTSQDGNSEIVIRMGDSPAPYTAVNIDVKAVEILYKDTVTSNCNDTDDRDDSVKYYCHCQVTSEQKWLKLVTITGIYNLLMFQNGLDTIIASDQIKAGDILEMRLILGTNNSLVIWPDTIPLIVPSGMETGLKLIINKPVSPHSKLEVLFDFDANSSVVINGNNKFILKPVLKLKMNS
jgi:hypothetical protein